MKPNDLYRLPLLSEPRLSPNGRQVAFMVTQADQETNDYRSAIWIVASDDSTPPRQLTSGSKRDAMPRWSPDGRSLLFLSNRETDASQLFVMPMDGGEPRKLTNLKEGVSSPSWSPDGTKIAFVSQVPGSWFNEEDEKMRGPRHITGLKFKADGQGFTWNRYSHVFVVDVEGSEEPRRLTEGDINHSDPVWSPDDKQLVFCAYREEDRETSIALDLHTVEIDTGAAKRITNGDGVHNKPSWSPDGKRIACRVIPDISSAPRNGQIAVIDLETGTRDLVTEGLDRQCAPMFEQREPIWINGDLLFPVEREGNGHLYLVPASGGDPKPFITGEFVVTDHDSVGSTLVHMISTPTRPPELFNGDTQLTNFTDEFCKSVELATPTRFTAVSHDGSEVEAWIMCPPGLRPEEKAPTLLFIHGGPFAQYRNAFFDEFQVAAGAGFAVLYSNPRGSSGYSEEWGRAIRGPLSGGPGMGTVDYEDVTAVVDTALAQFDVCDADRLGVLGGSYGGYLTAWIVSHTDRFKGACAERGLYNVVSAVGTSDGLWSSWIVWGGSPYDDIDRMWQMSPLAHFENINTPLLLIHSDQDLRTPVEQAEQVFVALRMRGKDVEFIRFPHGTHDLSRGGPPRQRVQRFEAINDWFGRHLQSESKEKR